MPRAVTRCGAIGFYKLFASFFRWDLATLKKPKDPALLRKSSPVICVTPDTTYP